MPDDGQRNCPKHVYFHSKNKSEELVHLVGFTIRERGKHVDFHSKNKSEKLVHLVVLL